MFPGRKQYFNYTWKSYNDINIVLSSIAAAEEPSKRKGIEKLPALHCMR